MSPGEQTAVQTAMAAFYRARGHKLLAPLTRGRGAILMLHSVSVEARRAFDPNAGLRINPEFVDRAIRLVRAEGYDIVDLDEARRRLIGQPSGRPFVAFTLDDGYRDNLTHAYPVFRQHQVPFCVYVPTAFADGSADLWWYALEGAIGMGRTLRATIKGSAQAFSCVGRSGMERAWQRLYWWLRSLDEDEARKTVADLCTQAGFDAAKLSGTLLMTSAEVQQLASDPLCTIGAHTVNHYSLAKLDADRCRQEIVRSKTDLEARLSRPVRHFSYPYGTAGDAGPREFAIAAEAGFATAVTTRKGLLFSAHANHLTALPRLSLNGRIQDERLLAVLLGGAPFAVMNGFRQVSVG